MSLRSWSQRRRAEIERRDAERRKQGPRRAKHRSCYAASKPSFRELLRLMSMPKDALSADGFRPCHCASISSSVLLQRLPASCNARSTLWKRVAELFVRSAERRLGVDLQVPPEVHQREEHVAEFVLDRACVARCPSPRAIRRSPPRSCRGWAGPRSSRSRHVRPSPEASALVSEPGRRAGRHPETPCHCLPDPSRGQCALRAWRLSLPP